MSAVQPTASMEHAFWVVFEYPGDDGKYDKFYSSHPSQQDADDLAADMNAAEAKKPEGTRRYVYRVVPKP